MAGWAVDPAHIFAPVGSASSFSFLPQLDMIFFPLHGRDESCLVVNLVE
jgi:hypothetical protein